MVTDVYGCSNTADVLVDLLYMPTVDIGRDTSFCDGGTVTLNAGPGYLTYEWEDASSGQTHAADANGLYWVRVSNHCGFVEDTVEITVHAMPEVDLGQDITACESDTLILDAGDHPGATFTWSSDVHTQTFTPNSSGTFWVKVVNEFDCASEDTVILSLRPSPSVDLGSDTFLCADVLGKSIRLDATYPSNDGYLWQDGSQGSLFTVRDSGTYSVEVNNICGVVRDEIIVDLKECHCKLWVPNAFSPNNDGNNDIFEPIVDCDIIGYTLMIFNRWGEKIFESRSLEYGWDGYYTTRLQDPGVYTYLIVYSGYVDYSRYMWEKKGSVLLLR